MKRFDDINVIPFIDIMLVLLAIVLTTATFIAQGKLDVTLPEAQSSNSAPQDPPVRIAIDRQGQYHYNGEEVALANLKGHIDDLESQTPVILVVDKGVAFGRFVTVMDALKVRGLNRLSVLTKHPKSAS